MMVHVALITDVYRNLRAASLRTALALIGIVVGCAAVVAIISCSQLATESALAQFNGLGKHLMSVSVFKLPQHGDNLSLQQWRSLSRSIPSIRDIAPFITSYQPISIDGQVFTGTIIGSDEVFAKQLHIHLAQGHFVSMLESFEPICVIGDDIASQLKQTTLESPLGKQVRIGNGLYTIIGVAAPWEGSLFFNESINKAVIIPIGSFALVNPNATINQALLRLKTNANVMATEQQLQTTLQQLASHANVLIQSPQQIIRGMNRQTRIFRLLLIAVGSITLLVAGIGIMNVMLAAISERSVEIGIRKAVGASQRAILWQFLLEAILLTMLGGALGVLLGLVLTRSIAYWFGWKFSVHFTPLLLGFLTSVVSGLLFGLYPAYRAAKLDPIVSLLRIR